MLVNGVIVGGRFRVIRNFGPATDSIALADDLRDGGLVWLIRVAASATTQQLSLTLEQQGRFALGVPGLARLLSSGVEAGMAFLAFVAPPGGSVAEARREAWSPPRIAALATLIAGALGPLHDQGIAHGCLRAELVAEGNGATGDARADVLFGFGVAAVATAFGPAGEASQLLPPDCRAPELRASLSPPTPSSDLFALGVLLGELLSAPALTVSSASGSEFRACLAGATAGDARARPRDVRAFARELTRLAAAVPVVPVVSAGAARLEAPAGGASLTADVGLEPHLDERAPVSPVLPPPVVSYPPLAVPPGAFPEPVLAWKPAPGRALLVWLAVGLGALLLAVGVPMATFFAARRAGTLAAHAPGKPAPKLALPVPSPTPSEPPPSPKPGPIPDSEPHRKPTANHAPMVAPGSGPMSFPEDAHAPLPVLGNEPIWGTRRAPLTWVLFGDLDCPHTRRAWRALAAAKASFGDDLRIVFRHRPLREHPNALDAARVLAGLAKRRGSLAFFDVLDRISRDDASLTPQRLAAVLSLAGYGAEPLAELAREGEPVVLSDVQLAGQFAVKSTPFSFLNGQPIDGERGPAELERLLDDEHRSATWSLASGVAANMLYSTRTSSNLIGVGDGAAARVCAPLTASPVRGARDALVTLVEFSDFECPYCARVEPTLRTLLERYPKTLRLVWKNYPLPQHKNARLLASFAADAKSRGSNAAFWAVHDALFEHQNALDDSTLGELASKAGLDGPLLLITARSGLHDAEIQSDIAVGQELGVNGTPVFFVNGRRVQGALGLPQFNALIQEELKSAERIVARGVPKKDVYGLLCE
ncbi:MAG: thioredoxin domain-containing protein [Pseudomonadota bacterium]